MNFIQNIIITSLLMVPLSMFGVICDAQGVPYECSVEDGDDVVCDVDSEEAHWLLIRAINEGDLSAVRELLKGGGLDLDRQNTHGMNVLMIAIQLRRRSILRKDGWISSGIPELVADMALSQYLDIVRELLAAGADPDLQDVYGRTALVMAVDARDIDTVRELLLAEADVNLRNNHGETALFRASIYGGHPGIIKELVNAGADVDLMCSEFRLFRRWSCDHFNRRIATKIMND